MRNLKKSMFRVLMVWAAVTPMALQAGTVCRNKKVNYHEVNSQGGSYSIVKHPGRVCITFREISESRIELTDYQLTDDSTKQTSHPAKVNYQYQFDRICTYLKFSRSSSESTGEDVTPNQLPNDLKKVSQFWLERVKSEFFYSQKIFTPIKLYCDR